MAAISRKTLTQALRIVWVIGAIGFLGYFLYRSWDEAVSLLFSLSWWQPVVAFALLLGGKACYVDVVRRMLRATGSRASYGFAFYAYSLSQLGKYIPGSVWQFVGRFEIYRGGDVTAARAVQLILLENLLMLGVAGFIALGAAPVLLTILSGYVPPFLLGIAIGFAILAALMLAWFVKPVRSRITQAADAGWRHRVLALQVLALFAAMWILMGASASILLVQNENMTLTYAAYVAALFCAAYVAGFVALFAPAGLGVREAVFVLGLSATFPIEAALLLTLGHRLLYVIVDIVMGLAALGLHGWAARQQA
ncbi:MAG: flippase-like domain-containing protein [Oceanicaulis sp.]|uniref:lysylphosphatidylglycerol synthase domain-containing protein n=1 Tax=Glycocaulis sp. TaxID=1969725 RepID=UPI0025BD0491|nr:lysylphosphatidylglycerol synthase domain-containing protein [Glycocaulis sp.]MCC5982600.1 flippase-like domain-containing protein [Oceanicaulis sp.]MCH8522405.1 hypothetical protein [Glycocaulis sp.]